nr:Lpe10 [Starmerella bombicola]
MLALNLLGLPVRQACRPPNLQLVKLPLAKLQLTNSFSTSTSPQRSGSWWHWSYKSKDNGRRKFRKIGKFQPSPLQATPISTNEQELNQILARTLNRTISSSIRCTLINRNGKVQINRGEFKRSDLVARFGLLPRDLRKLDVSTHNIVPAILVRDTSILVNLLHIRAIIKQDCVLLVDVTAEDQFERLQSLFLQDLEHRIKQSASGTNASPLPYELRALEAILVSVIYTLNVEFVNHEQRVQSVLKELEENVDRERLQELLVQSKVLGAFVQKVVLIRNELEELVDSDKEMAGLYLSSNAPQDESDVEVMLESYYSQCDEIVQAAENLSENIKSTEEYINILLDSNRNSLMLLEVRFQIGMLGLSAGSAIAALYGMNLQNMIEDSSWGFLTVCGTIGVLSIATVAVGLKRLARAHKLKERFR